MINPNNLKIRLYIMTIALLGGLGFLSYLLFNISVAQKHEDSISQLHTIKFPVLEHFTTLKQGLRDVHEDISTALVLEHGFLLEETYSTIKQLSGHINVINELDPTTVEISQGLKAQIDAYFVAAKEVADVLINSPEQSRLYEEKILNVNFIRHQLNNQLDQILETLNAQYVVALGNTNEQMKSANQFGAVLGFILIVALVVLAWVISVTVLIAINKSDKLKEIFLATMSHELRTPINGISGAISLLKDTDPTDKQKILLDACKLSELSMTTAIDDILEFTSMMSGKIRITPQAFSLQKNLDDIILMFKNDYQMKGLSIAIDDQLPPGLIYTDLNRITHVLRHLIGNAIKFSDQGYVHVRLVAHDINGIKPIPKNSSIDNKKCIKISIIIEDNGPGIDNNLIEDALKPFHQINGSFSRQHQGMGIGLPICSSIAKAMLGKIELQNREKGGLCVRFIFNSPLKEDLQKNTQSVTKVRATTHLKKILIVEDNNVNRMILNGFIQKLGFHTDTANNGEEGLNLATKNDYAMIMMDCQMPIMDGFESTKNIRKIRGKKGQVPIIAVTANAMDGDKKRCLESGMNHYIKKPINMDILKKVMSDFNS
jgi:signal transduction histidine kinase/ActR/RegA family two-component response regulator